jgi:sugar phosphate isomerase/epimerase
VHDRISINSLCFFGAPLDQVADGFSQLAPRRVSLISDLVTGDPAAASAVLADGGYALETVSHRFIAGHLDPAPETWERPRADLKRALESAATLGARSMYVLTGGHGSLTWEQAAECFGAAIEPCLGRARELGVRLLTENSSQRYADMHICHSLRDTVTLAELAGVGVCIDLYGCWSEADLRASLERAMPRCGLIQISDYVYGDPVGFARAVPGDGAIPLQRILGWALDAGYSGNFDLELIGPRIDAEGRVTATRRAADHVEQLLESLGA